MLLDPYLRTVRAWPWGIWSHRQPDPQPEFCPDVRGGQKCSYGCSEVAGGRGRNSSGEVSEVPGEPCGQLTWAVDTIVSTLAFIL